MLRYDICLAHQDFAFMLPVLPSCQVKFQFPRMSQFHFAQLTEDAFPDGAGSANKSQDEYIYQIISDYYIASQFLSYMHCVATATFTACALRINYAFYVYLKEIYSQASLVMQFLEVLGHLDFISQCTLSLTLSVFWAFMQYNGGVQV